MRRLVLLPFACLLLLPIFPAERSDARSLADDGRVATVMEVQGTALVRPAGRGRWSPLGPKSLLLPGDLVRTDARGAHALEIQMTKGQRLVIGPGTVVELPAEGGIRLLRGVLEAKGGDAPVPVTGPGAYKQDIKGTAWLQTRGKTTRTLEEQPKWLEGYRASASDEWMGSLLANVDGKSVPLAVGYHKVNVDIKDQIARTTVEQSFINTTDVRLEGIFYFPLPADASISGFGMWIGGELVEADIVEKQRARQIYEDILRRKKDPGLLEWEGGNLFKARVFPIEAHSEKRVRIRYTQVLPLEGSTYRYRYALRSELLRTKPLRELQLLVRIVSETPLGEVASPTHECRINQTGHEAEVEFTAQQYSPEQDFELAVAVKGRQDLVALPHRRGEDGYFMLQLTPPDASDAGWQRELLPEGEPLDLLLIADTSGSMDAAARANQEKFLSSTLSLLGEKDTFRLMVCDAEAAWIESERLPATDATVDGALDKLATRRSLGWTDIDLALDTALTAADEKTTVLYVGDGIGTTGDADPVALAERIRARGAKSEAVVHAIAVSSKYEAPVLAALARIGGGSVRSVGADPVGAAYQVLSEAARPVVKDLKVRIDGIRTARVYPEVLPNLPLGAQQVVLGRFLPGDQPQSGTVTMSGLLDGKPVQYTAKLSIPAADVGNSFLPRLWARRHLDALLAGGNTPEIREEIISFSERFGIMTPYTSFLVLESDEDRERYGVARRVRMRDGERFFADARDRATLEITRQSVKNAARWRQELRRGMLREIADLGRSLPIAEPTPRFAGQEINLGDGPWDADEVTAETIGIGGGAGGSFGGRGGGRAGSRGRSLGSNLEDLEKKSEDAWGADDAEDRQRGEPNSMPARDGLEQPSAGGPKPKSRAASPAESPANELDSIEEFEEELADKRFDREARRSRSKGYMGRPENVYGGGMSLQQFGGRLVYPRPPHVLTLSNLGFPHIPEPPKKDDDETPDPDFDPAIAKLFSELWMRPKLGELGKALHLTSLSESLHTTRQSVTGFSQAELRLAPSAWVFETAGLHAQPAAQWVHAGKRAGLAKGKRLARSRDAEPEDARAWHFPLWNLHVQPLAKSWRGWRGTLVRGEDGMVEIHLRRIDAPDDIAILVIDESRKVLLEQRRVHDGKVTGRTTYDDYVQIAGLWWPRRVETRDDDDAVTQRRTLTVEEIEVENVAENATRLTASLSDAIVVDGKLPTITESKERVHERKAGFIELLTLALHHAATQQWDPTWERWDAAEALEAKKIGSRWIRASFMHRARIGEAFKQHVQSMVAPVVATSGLEGAYAAPELYGVASRVLGPNERLDLLTELKTGWIEAGVTGAELREKRWHWAMVNALQGIDDQAGARALVATMFERWPTDLDIVLRFEADRFNVGHRDDAVATLATSVSQREPWTDRERHSLYVRYTDRLWALRRLDKLAAVLDEWVKRRPEYSAPYQRRIATRYLRGDTDAGDAHVERILTSSFGADAQEDVWAELSAAIMVALGDGWAFRVSHVDSRWHAPLRDVVLRLARMDLDRRRSDADRIMREYRFRRTDAYKQVHAALREDLAADGAVESMARNRLGWYVRQLSWHRNNVDQDVFDSMVARLTTRWEKTEDRHEIDAAAANVLHVLDQHGDKDAAIVFVRKRLEREPDDRKHTIARDLVNRLVAGKHSEAVEAELFSLLQYLPAPEDGEEMIRSRLAKAVRSIGDRLYRWRYEKALGTPEERKALTRAEQKLRRKESRATARRELVTVLAAATPSVPEPARPWMDIERLCYAIEAGDDIPAVATEARGVLRADWEPNGNPLDRVLRERAAAVLAYGCTRRNAPETLPQEVLGDFSLALTAQAEVLVNDEKAVELMDWHYQIYRLLIALDRPDDLEKRLTSWIIPAKVESRWRIALGYLYAETSRLAPAAEQFETVRAQDELGAAQYEALATWYLVLDDDARRNAALLGRYQSMGEWQLGNLLYEHQRKVAPRRRGGMPEDLDPEALLVMQALMRKSSYPGNQLYRVRNIYRAVKDHRLLESMVDGLPGHTKEGIYSFLRSAQTITNEIHEEATCDALVARIEAVAAESDSPLDRRALMLFRAAVEHRAAQVQDADPVHADRAYEALRGALDNEWQPGEKRLLAQYLSGLRFPQAGRLETVQMSHFQAMYRGEPADSKQRFWIAFYHAQAEWGYGRGDRAIDRLTTALDDERERAGLGWLPHEANHGFQTLVSWHTQRSQFLRAERLILEERARRKLPIHVEQLDGQLYNVYIQALRKGGSVSLGRGNALFDAATSQLAAVLQRAPFRMNQLFSTYCQLHQTDRGRPIVNGADDRLHAYGKQTLPGLLERLPLQATNLAGTMAGALRRLTGPRSGIRYLLDRRDIEPTWLRRISYDVWYRHNRSLAQWRYDAGNLGDLEPRLLKVVIAALERRLETGSSRGGYFWNRNNKWYWGAQATEFAATATRILERHESSPAIIWRVAHFQRNDLGLRREAVATLMAAHKRELLDINRRWTLGSWLRDDKRFEEALPIALALREEKPRSLPYRQLVIDAYGGLDLKKEALAALLDTETTFRELKIWTESAAAGLAQQAVTYRFAEHGVRLYEEAIRLRTDTRGYRGGRDNTIANYNLHLAKGRAQLGRIEEAVQAASAALVAIDRSQRSQDRALGALREVLREAEDLSAYVATYDAEVAKTGLDAPLLRRELGAIFLDKEEYDAAVTQLRAARELDGTDARVHQLLVKAYDGKNDAEGAIDALFGSIRMSPHNLDAYESLAGRYERTNPGASDVERALTTMVENTPHDADGHRKLAQIRETQGRLEDAVVQWEQVVRTRSLEPDGYLALVRLLIRLERTDEARKHIRHLMTSKWEQRFGDVAAKASALLETINN